MIGAAGAIIAAFLSLGSSPATLVSERTVTVSRGVIQTVVSGSGNLEPARQVDVDFATSGKITKVYVEAGAHVSKDELLARLDNRSAKVAVAKAHADVVDAQDALTAAQDAAASATTATDAGATATTSGATARQTIAMAAQAPSASPTATPRGGVTPTPTPTATPRGAAPAATATPTATGASPSGADNSGSGGSAQSVESAQAAVDSALLALDDAENALDDTIVRSPMAGTVASISGSVGDTAGSSSQSGGDTTSSSAFLVLAQLSRLKLEVGLSESDIGKVKVGQSATVTVNAASGEDVAAHVTSVGVLASDDSAGTTGSSAVSYPVVITLDQTTDGLKAGMSATADIVVARVTGLAVPSQALRGSSVTVDKNGARTTQRVQTGVVGDSATQVVSGLSAGDKVIVTSTSAASGQTAAGGTQQTRTGVGGAGGFGGGGFRGAGAGGGGFGGPPGGPGG
jgi:multidrug efflux pump subunit AcrA (membrane-fusion protein)